MYIYIYSIYGYPCSITCECCYFFGHLRLLACTNTNRTIYTTHIRFRRVVHRLVAWCGGVWYRYEHQDSTALAAAALFGINTGGHFNTTLYQCVGRKFEGKSAPDVKNRTSKNSTFRCYFFLRGALSLANSKYLPPPYSFDGEVTISRSLSLLPRHQCFHLLVPLF